MSDRFSLYASVSVVLVWYSIRKERNEEMTPEKLLKPAQKGNAYIAGKDGYTAADFAEINGHNDIAAFLKKE